MVDVLCDYVCEYGHGAGVGVDVDVVDVRCCIGCVGDLRGAGVVFDWFVW